MRWDFQRTGSGQKRQMLTGNACKLVRFAILDNVWCCLMSIWVLINSGSLHQSHSPEKLLAARRHFFWWSIPCRLQMFFLLCWNLHFTLYWLPFNSSFVQECLFLQNQVLPLCGYNAVLCIPTKAFPSHFPKLEKSPFVTRTSLHPVDKMVKLSRIAGRILWQGITTCTFCRVPQEFANCVRYIFPFLFQWSTI